MCVCVGGGGVGVRSVYWDMLEESVACGELSNWFTGLDSVNWEGVEKSVVHDLKYKVINEYPLPSLQGPESQWLHELRPSHTFRLKS